MELTIKVNPTERTVRFREVHALAAGDAYSSVTLSGVTGAQTAALQLKLFKDSSASAVLAQCSSFAEVPGHPSERRGAMTLATQALKDWYESIVNDATATDTNGMPSALVNAWLVISDSVKTWAACQVPLILRAMDTNVVQGADGISPVVSLTKSGGVLTISITDVNGTHTETVSDGQDGPPGVSPTLVVDVNPATGNVRVTAVNADGSATTREVDVSGKAEKSEMSVTAGADATKKTIQLKSGLSQEVLVAHQDVSGKAEKSEMSVTAGTDATKKVVQLKNGLSQTVLVEHQDVSGKMDGEAAYPAWSAASYPEGQIVWHAGKAWIALNDAVPADEPGDGSTWLEYDGTLYAQIRAKQDALSAAQLANIAAVPNKANTGDVAEALALKAAAADLPYRLVTLATPTEWVFSGVEEWFEITSGPDYDSGQQGWYLSVASVPQGWIDDIFVSGASDATSLTFTVRDMDGEEDDATVVATKTGYALLDRAGNRVVVSGDTTLTLPAAIPGYLRDFLVRLEISGSAVPTITFAAPTGETITYETDGDEFPVPDEAGDWLYSFTESCVAHKFAVSLKKVNEVAQGGA